MQKTYTEIDKYVVLSDNRKIVLDDKNEVSISVIYDKETKFTFPVPYPLGGYGGGALFLSPSEQYLIFVYYSGQSEEAFRLYKIYGFSLELVYEIEYLYGEEGSYCFSNNEEKLIQTLRTGSWYRDEAETDEIGDKLYEFGIINILDIYEKILQTHKIHVYPSSAWQEEITDNGPFYLIEIADTGAINVKMPWGYATLLSPLDDVIVFRPK